MTLPTVSVIVVNFNGRELLEACFKSLLRQDYPTEHVEVILVDNGSQDNSLEVAETLFPSVNIIKNSTNVGFAPAVNQGAAAATGDYLALINNDAYANRSWLQEMVQTLEAHRDTGVVCVGSKMLDWYGRKIDFIGGGMNFYGQGDQFFHQLPIDAIDAREEEILFACGGAMLVDREVFFQVGGLDSDYFAYFEDVDFGWRLWLYGYRVLLAPNAIVYHRQHATANTASGYQVRMLMERNAIITIIKNYDEEHLYRILPAALMLLIQKSLLEGAESFDRREFDLQQRSNDHQDYVTVSKAMFSYIVGAGDILAQFPDIWKKRQRIQSERTRPDEDIFPLFKRPMGTNYLAQSYLLLQQHLTDAFGIRDLFSVSQTTRVLVISSDPLSDTLAGPGIRAMEIARYLAHSCHVTLAAPDKAEVSVPNVACVAFQRYDQETVAHIASQAEVIIAQGFTFHHYPIIKQLHKILVVDLYDPFYLENLEIHTSQAPAEHIHQRTSGDLGVLNDQLRVGDFFICASERQRDFWLGNLVSQGRVSPEGYMQDSTFRSLIDVVPFGLNPEPPMHQKQVLKGIIPGIAEDDKVVLWGGGIWEWFDPLVVIRAMQMVRTERPNLKLFFLGAQHPNTVDVPRMYMYDRAVALAKELDVYNQTVFFNEHWVAYSTRANYLLEADIGVSAHLEHIETRFAFRTRILDYIWAGLPMVVTTGDALADMVVERGLGYAVDIGDVEGFAGALLTLSGDTHSRSIFAEAFAKAQHDFAWPNVLKPLIAFCQNPRYAPDRR